jgi:hypothetical protein
MGDTTSTVFAAKLQGIRLALMMALEDWNKGNRRKKLIIYSDNQASIMAVGNPSGKSGAYIIADIVHLICYGTTCHGYLVTVSHMIESLRTSI